MVRPISTNICLDIPLTKTMGKKTHTVVRVEEVIAGAISLAPSMDASFADIPSFLRRTMFSITTMELSTNIPTPRAKPPKDMMFMVTPVKYIMAIANIRLIGMDTAITMVGFMSFKNNIRTKIASNPP